MTTHETDRLEMHIEALNMQTNGLEQALDYLQPKTPLTTTLYEQLCIEEKWCLDTIINRFAKIQDQLGDKIFPKLLFLLGKNNKALTFIDQLNVLEKLDLLPNVQQWLNFRKIHNDISHEYPCSTKETVEKVNVIIDGTKFLVQYWKELKPKIEIIKKQYDAI